MTQDRAAARACVEELYAAHHAEIYAYLSRMVRDNELAADLAQETFVKAFRAYDTLMDHDRARAWLYQIAGRTALDELRRRKIVRFVPWTGESRGVGASAEDLVLDRASTATSSARSARSRRASGRRCCSPSCRVSTVPSWRKRSASHTWRRARC